MKLWNKIVCVCVNCEFKEHFLIELLLIWTYQMGAELGYLLCNQPASFFGSNYIIEKPILISNVL
jgi:hypothetical protein